MTSEYMNNLYRDLLSNSPQTVTIPIPSDMGTGQIAQVVTKQGAVVSDWKMNYFSDMNVRGINSEDYIQMLFCLNDGVSWNIAGSREGACLAKGESCIYRGHGKMESLCYAQNSDFYFKNIKIPVPYFKRLLQDYFEDGEITVYEKKLLTGISKVSITPYMEHIFAELQDFTHYRGGLGYLFLESKIHELLSVYLSEVLELRILSPEYCCMHRPEGRSAPPRRRETPPAAREERDLSLWHGRPGSIGSRSGERRFAGRSGRPDPKWPAGPAACHSAKGRADRARGQSAVGESRDWNFRSSHAFALDE